MKYTKLFNNHDEYVVYTGGTNFITPNVSWCVEEREAHCTPKLNIPAPVITCSNNEVTIICYDVEADIYYRINKTGEYSAYTEAFTITADTIVEAYSELSTVKSHLVEQTCYYNNGVETPTMYFDGDYVTINSETPSVDLYYRLNETGNYSAYTGPIEITANTTVEAYAELDGKRSSVNKETFTYVAPPESPVIICDGENVIITCATVGANISYKLNGTGDYSAYTGSIAITADTIVQAYSTLNGRNSLTVTEECVYNPVHDYSLDYLTFRVLTGGTIMWVARNNITKTISYSKDNGATWTEITASSTGTPINVSVGETVLLKGNNDQYATAKDTCSCFSGGTAYYDVEGNIMSLIGGDNFTGLTSFNNKSWVFHDLFAQSKVVSAKNLILPVMTLTTCCYRAMFSKVDSLVEAPALSATTLAASAYTYMFDVTSITKAPDLPATTLTNNCYHGMFQNCHSLNYIKCMATNISASNCTSVWVQNVSASGTFVKDSSMTSWTTGNNGIPTGWIVKDDGAIAEPTISFDGFDTITLSCETTGADIYYRLNQTGNYSAYTTEIVITADTIVEAYSEKDGDTSSTVSQTCVYVSVDPFTYSNRSLDSWTYVNDSIDVTVPYSVNAIDGHSSHYKTDGDTPKLPFSFDTSFGLKEAQPTYLWFEHADQSADIYVDNTLVETHWGGYNAFFSDISNYVHSGTNNIRVSLRNKIRNELAPCAGDFNFNATLGYVKLFTSPYMPDKEYGYDGFHVTSQFEYSDTAHTTASAATITIKTSIPTGATVICTINSGETNIYSATSASTGEEMTFTTPSLTGTNLHLWDGMADPFLYDITLEIYHGQDLYHRYTRPYGLRYYEYLINDTTRYGTAQNPFTGFKLNGHSYLLRGVCMHHDKANKANALTSADTVSDFNIVQELGCNFIRLAHYPHTKVVYDTCDRLGIVVQTEVPWVNQSSSSQPEAYYTRLSGQCDDMVKQHYNHPCIFFWGLANEITPSTTSFTKSKIEQYTAQIKALDSERMVGFVSPMSVSNPTQFDSPNVDWYGYNCYEGWYQNKNTNNPTSALNTRVTNTIINANKAMAFSEYGAGGTSTCHSDDFMNTTTRGNNPRHDIEYMMWLHEGHIAAIKNFPQLMFTSQWQLFDIAVCNRQEGYKVCLDGETVTDNDNLKYLNNKGLVERDHVTKKDTFYLYKAWWNSTPFVHICQQNYTKRIGRVIKCYTNDGNLLTMYVNGVSAATATVTNNIALFEPRTFNVGDVIKISGSTSSDEFEMPYSPSYNIVLTAKYDITDTSNPTRICGSDYISAFEEIEIDGVVQQEVVSSYTFSTTGEHIVKYKLDNASINNNAFSGCSNMTSIDIPSGVTSIGNSAFYYCNSITSITIPNSVTNIGNGAFQYCSGLTTITVDSNNTVYDSRNDCNAIIKTSTNELIVGCQSTIIPNTVTSIGNSAFFSCRSLTSIDIPNSVTSIGNYAFQWCIDLTSCTIGSGVTSIGDYAFNQCSSLSSITIPNSVTSIGNYAFDNCVKITSVTIGSGVTSIGIRAFYDCGRLTSINIPNSVTKINGYAFGYCTSLTSVTIGNSVTNIGGDAFQYCTSLTSIISNATTAPSITGTTFFNIKNGGTLYVPIGSSGYDAWMSRLNSYNWTKVEQ